MPLDVREWAGSIFFDTKEGLQQLGMVGMGREEVAGEKEKEHWWWWSVMTQWLQERQGLLILLDRDRPNTGEDCRNNKRRRLRSADLSRRGVSSDPLYALLELCPPCGMTL